MKNILILCIIILLFGCKDEFDNLIKPVQKSVEYDLEIVFNHKLNSKNNFTKSISNLCYPISSEINSKLVYIPNIKFVRIDLKKEELFQLQKKSDFFDVILEDILGGKKSIDAYKSEIDAVFNEIGIPDILLKEPEYDSLGWSINNYISKNYDNYFAVLDESNKYDKIMVNNIELPLFNSISSLRGFISKSCDEIVKPNSETKYSIKIIFNPIEFSTPPADKNNNQIPKIPSQKELRKRIREKEERENFKKIKRTFENENRSVNDVSMDVYEVQYPSLSLDFDSAMKGFVKFQNDVDKYKTKLDSSKQVITNLLSRLTRITTENEKLRREIAEMEKLIDNLRGVIDDQKLVIEAQEKIIETLLSEIEEKNSVFYYIASSDKAESDSIIVNGKFLFFNTGSSLAKNYTQSINHFSKIHMHKDKDIFIGYGFKKEDIELLSNHNKLSNLYYDIILNGRNETRLLIKNPNQFWSDKYLVILIPN